MNTHDPAAGPIINTQKDTAMTTPLLPTKDQLTAITLTPLQFRRDREIELQLTRYYQDYIASIMSAFRNGSTEYAGTVSNAILASNLRKILSEYGYAVKKPDSSLGAGLIVTVSWAAANPYPVEDRFSPLNFTLEPVPTNL